MNITDFQKKVDEFINYLKIEKNISPHTLRAYKTDLKQFIDFWHQSMHNQNVAIPLRLIFERYFVALYHKKMSKPSIARKISCFQSLIRYIKSHGIDVSVMLTRPRLDKKLPVYLSVEEINYLLDEITPDTLNSPQPYRDFAVFELLYATGMRCSELVNIRMEDLNLDEKTIRIKGKGNKERIALFGTKAQKRIKDYLHYERTSVASSQESLFLNSRNIPLTQRTIQRICETFRAHLKIDKKLTPHKLRHSFATHLLNAGTDLRVVQELLGHASLSSTEKYTHITPKQLAEMCDTQHPINEMMKKKS